MIQITSTISINEREIKLDFIRSSGPGGQNVNKVATAVQLRFDVRNSPSLPDEVRDRIVRLAGKKMTVELAINALEASLDKFASISDFTTDSLETIHRPLAEELGLKTGQLFGTLRVATTGKTVAPPLFQTMEVLGKDKCLKRIQSALDVLKSAE